VKSVIEEKSVLNKPVFVIGVPRSGTTIIYEALCRHELLGWLANYSEMLPAFPAMNLLRRILDNRFISVYGHKKQHDTVVPGNRYLPQPDEAYAFWNHYARTGFSKDYLGGMAASREEIERVRAAVLKTVRYQGRKRFSAKLTGPGRISYLSSIFPDAVFIHVIRDGRAVVNSLLRVAFWKQGGGLERPYWRNGFPDEFRGEWENTGKQATVLAALQWRNIIEQSRKEAESLRENQYYEVRYEDWVNDPVVASAGLLDCCGLPASAGVERYIRSTQKVRNMNSRASKVTDAGEQAVAWQAMQPLLGELGYDG